MGSMSVGHVGGSTALGGQARIRAGGAHTSRALTPGAKQEEEEEEGVKM